MLLCLALLPALAASPQPGAPALPWRTHTVAIDDGSTDYRTSLGRPGYAAALASAIDLAVVPSGARAAAFARDGIAVSLALDVNRCAGSRGAAAFGYATAAGADAASVPDCSDRDRWRDSAFYRVGSDLLFVPTSGGGTFGVLGNPASPVFRRASLASMHDLLAAAALPGASLFLRDVASPDEMGSACVAAEDDGAPYACADTDDVSDAQDASDWLGGETELIARAPRNLYLDGLASYDADPAGTHHAMAEVARLAANANVVGAVCDDCFYASDFAQLAYQERSAMAVIAAHKRVIVVDEGPHGAPRYRPTPPRERTTALAAIALFYEYNLTSIASRSCGPASGIGVCPETTLVFRDPSFTATDPEKLRDPGGAYRRAFGSCLVGGVDYGSCVAFVNAKPYAVLAAGLAGGAGGAGFSLVVKGYALPLGFGDIAGTLTFHPLGETETDGPTGRVKLAAQSGMILFASATPRS